MSEGVSECVEVRGRGRFLSEQLSPMSFIGQKKKARGSAFSYDCKIAFCISHKHGTNADGSFVHHTPSLQISLIHEQRKVR